MLNEKISLLSEFYMVLEFYMDLKFYVALNFFYSFLAVFVKNIFPFSPLLISKRITFLTKFRDSCIKN